MNEQISEFDWSPLGEAFWIEAQKTTGASDLQVRFACCRHRGMSASGSARAAGYTGDNDTIRQAGSRAAKTTAVMELLSLAAAEAGGGDDGVVGTDEARRILSRLARGSDPNARIRAVEMLQKLDTRTDGESPDDDGLGPWRVERDYLLQDNGAVAYVLMFIDRHLMGNIGNLCLLHDTHALMIRQRFGPELWQVCRDRLSETGKADLDKKLADRNWQLEARRKVWAEVGVILDAQGQFRTGAVYAS
jgi:hypothetical protein